MEGRGCEEEGGQGSALYKSVRWNLNSMLVYVEHGSVLYVSVEKRGKELNCL